MLNRSAVRRAAPRAAIAAALLSTTAAAWAADYAGTYRGDIKGQPATVELSAGGAGYAGTIRLGTANLPCRATDQGDHLAGTFDSQGNSYPFSAALAGDTLTVTTGGATYTLRRATAEAAPTATATLPAGVTELTRTAAGRAVVVAEPSATTADAALDAALPGLARVVGSALTVTGRFADTKQPDRGGASFTGTVDGRPVRGIALCGKSTAGGDDVSVAWCADDAPAAEWQALTAALPHAVKLQTYSFPDGTGSIGVPDGWTCDAKSAADPVGVVGPDGQNVVMGGVLSVSGPRSPAAHMKQMTDDLVRKNKAFAQRYGRPYNPPPRPPQMDMYGDFDDPLPLLQHIYPQFSQILQDHGKPPRQIDQVLACTTVPAGQPGGRAQLASLLFTEGTGPSAVHYRQMGRFEDWQVGNFDVTLLMSNTMRARADRFDRDLPTMVAVARSFKTNDQQLAAVGQQRCDQLRDDSRRAMAAQQQRFDQQQQMSFAVHQQQMDASAERFNRFEDNINAQNMASHRAAQDFTEMVSGVQKVVDTRTGEVGYVDYYDSKAIVAGLNDGAGDPHEYVAVHRRDEVYPLGN